MKIGFASCKKIDISQLWVNDVKHEIYIIQTSMPTFSQGYSKKFSEKLTFFMKILSLSKEVKEKLWVKSHTSRGEREIFLSKSHKSRREREFFLKNLEIREEKENLVFKFLKIEKRKRNEN